MEVLERVGRLEERVDGHDKDIARLEQTVAATVGRVEKKVDRILFTVWGWFGTAAIAMVVYLLNRG